LKQGNVCRQLAEDMRPPTDVGFETSGFSTSASVRGDLIATNPIGHSSSHGNAFGFLRLLFASLVIVSHSTELFDGNRGREPLTKLFGTISFGDLAVDCFFIISGYLVVGSYIKRPGVSEYLLRRAARIYPGFLVASIISLAIIAPLVGADPQQLVENPFGMVMRSVLLQPPRAIGAFDALPSPHLNEAMWTIAYEFRCYLLVLALGALGCFRRPRDIALLAAISLILFELVSPSIFEKLNLLLPYSDYWFGRVDQSLRFSGMFLMGALFYLLRDRVRFTGRGLLLAVISFLICLSIPKLAQPAVATFGAYIIFAAARWGGSNPLGRVNHDIDISYGVYLYAWPTTQLLVRSWAAMSSVLAGLITLTVVIFCGWLSWRFVEQPIIAKVRLRSDRRFYRNGLAEAAAR